MLIRSIVKAWLKAVNLLFNYMPLSTHIQIKACELINGKSANEKDSSGKD